LDNRPITAWQEALAIIYVGNSTIITIGNYFLEVGGYKQGKLDLSVQTGFSVENSPGRFEPGRARPSL